MRRVSGVRGIALDLDVKLAPEHKRSEGVLSLELPKKTTASARKLTVQ